VILRILELLLYAVDLVPHSLSKRHQIRCIGRHGFEVEIELPQQIVGSWRRRGNPAIAG
jgi:hypothetical protein